MALGALADQRHPLPETILFSHLSPLQEAAEVGRQQIIPPRLVDLEAETDLVLLLQILELLVKATMAVLATAALLHLVVAAVAHLKLDRTQLLA